ncbi:MAG: GAF domain-containing protein, partial [Dehalococcoidia bacterium]
FILKACSGWPEDKQDYGEIEYLTLLAGMLLTSSSPIYIQDVAGTLSTGGENYPDKRILAEKYQKMSGQKQIRLGSVMMMPLVVQDEVLGALSINDTRPHAFGPAEGRLLTIAAAQISTAVQNSKLYDNLEQRAVELETALNKVEEAHRLKTEFVENVSHELRTPLTFIKAYGALILEGSLGEVSSTVKERLEIIFQKVEAIIRLVEDLVYLQKIEAGKLRLEMITAHELIIRVSEAARASAAERNIEIVVNSAPTLPRVRVDADRMGQVFDNLVGNALKFSATGSKIVITAAADGDKIKFLVQDYGLGIPADKLDKIFDRFYQVDNAATRRHGGAGLGLTIVKQIIEAHGGYITVASEVNKGTTFSFWLDQDSGVESTHSVR